LLEIKLNLLFDLLEFEKSDDKAKQVYENENSKRWDLCIGCAWFIFQVDVFVIEITLIDFSASRYQAENYIKWK